jgi:glycosyltransferase involved in cell wall biosynthesis
LFPAKGVAELLTAFAGVRHRVPDAHLVIAGHDVSSDGAYLTELQQLAVDLGVAGEVHFVGRRDDVQNLMAAADVFALPSPHEPFGLVYLEAMSMQLPVVGPNHGGASEIVEHGETGLLSTPDDLGALESNIVTLLEDPSLRSEMGRRGRERVETLFTLSRQCEVMAEVYRSALGRR